MVQKSMISLHCCSIPVLISSLLLSLLSFFVFHLSTLNTHHFLSLTHFSPLSNPNPSPQLNVFVAELPTSLNYGLLGEYWSLHDTRLGHEADAALRASGSSKMEFPPYPENPLIKQYSAEYWLLGDLMTPEKLRGNSVAKRVYRAEDADVILVPFFATLSAEMQLSQAKGKFRGKKENDDYLRQREVMDLVMGSEAWKRSGGRDHVFVLTDPVAMWHVKEEIASAVLLVVDFGGWYRQDSKASSGNSSGMIHHTQVSLLKDVIVPYTHLLPRLHLSEDAERHTLLYFKGAKHRHRGGLVREKLWDLLENEPGVVMEEGFPNATGMEQSIRGMRSSEFCLHPAGDTPTSCRLFDAIQSLCIPLIVSDNIELPFEGIIDYSSFSVFVSVSKAMEPKWLLGHLRSFLKEQRDSFRKKLAQVQPIFEFDNGHPGGIGPIATDGAVNNIWRKIHEKVPMIREAIVREKRKPEGTSIPLRCHCT
ncbi:probable arabinosyltransferase ARAD1 [Amborella trichopoda]|uniref:Exostosin GT47 domain-containing protein n=1 Tax=Amborella trichopoda TaxID=13333 RepID=U5CW66_AMBTC|nr:probable arabinosyltransferase ARAD1 [Amborella trichopoda]ERN14384.1 hypothetical protein AMTR_s00033p00229880 [Amborella trichopoda]|eukprot:XP_006852917.1 probable arabinosyltransferase ARAD1 [Amborella trichopoda]